MYTDVDAAPARLAWPSAAAAAAVITLGVLGAAFGGLVLLPQIHDPRAQCGSIQGERNLPVDIDSAPAATIGSWPIDVTCTWDLGAGDLFVVNAGRWAPTLLIYGGALLVAAGSVAGVAGRTHRNRAGVTHR